MRTALTILIIVALVLVAIGAVNHTVTLDLDFLAVSWSGVSLFWVAVALAAVALAAGIAGAWAARGSAVAAQRRLEKELASTYKRLRDAQALLERSAPASAGAAVADVTVLTPAPPGAAAATADDTVAADVTAVTAAVALSSVAGWDDVTAPAPPGEGPADVAAEVATVLTAAAAPGPAEEQASAAEAGAGEADEGTDASRPFGSHDDDPGAEVTSVTAVVPPDRGADSVAPADGPRVDDVARADGPAAADPRGETPGGGPSGAPSGPAPAS